MTARASCPYVICRALLRDIIITLDQTGSTNLTPGLAVLRATHDLMTKYAVVSLHDYHNKGLLLPGSARGTSEEVAKKI